MPEHSETAEQPLPHPWANRRMRGGDVPRRPAHPWATRNKADADARPLYPVFSERVSAQVSTPRPARPISRRQDEEARALELELELLAEADSSAVGSDPGADGGRGSGRTAGRGPACGGSAAGWWRCRR